MHNVGSMPPSRVRLSNYKSFKLVNSSDCNGFVFVVENLHKGGGKALFKMYQNPMLKLMDLGRYL